MPRKLRKGLIELGLTAAIAAIGFALDSPEAFGLGASSLFVLAQVRRAMRDRMQGEPE